MSQLIVNEIFHSIQGESTRAGLPCVFVRLTSCNLRCAYCDTPYAFEEGVPLSLEDILCRVRSYHCRLVEITGGEPLLQEPVHELMSRLCDEGFEVLLETGGSIDVGRVDPRVRRIVDFKCPGSGMEKKNHWANVGHLRPTDEVKFVVGNREDFDWAVAKVREFRIDQRTPILLSPVFGVLAPAQLAEWILESDLCIRMQLQLHKYVWHPETRGV
jgi:7-carboxy-7-deazaguanine synthase